MPVNIQLDIDCDRETERIFSMFSSNLTKLQKMEGKKTLYYSPSLSLSLSLFFVVSLFFFPSQHILKCFIF